MEKYDGKVFAMFLTERGAGVTDKLQWKNFDKESDWCLLAPITQEHNQRS